MSSALKNGAAVCKSGADSEMDAQGTHTGICILVPSLCTNLNLGMNRPQGLAFRKENLKNKFAGPCLEILGITGFPR